MDVAEDYESSFVMYNKFADSHSYQFDWILLSRSLFVNNITFQVVSSFQEKMIIALLVVVFFSY